MCKQVIVNHAICLISGLALLVSVMTSPIRSNVTSSISHPNHLRRNFGVPSKAPAHQRPNIPVGSRVVQVKALSTETKVECLEYPSSLRMDLPYLAALPVESIQDLPACLLDRTSYAPRC